MGKIRLAKQKLKFSDDLKKASLEEQLDAIADSPITQTKLFEPSNPGFKPALPQFTEGIKLVEMVLELMEQRRKQAEKQAEQAGENVATIKGGGILDYLKSRNDTSGKKKQAFSRIVSWSHSDTLKEENYDVLSVQDSRDISSLADQHMIASPNFAEYYKNIIVPEKTKEYVIPLLSKKGEPLIGAKFSIDPKKIYAGLNQLNLLSSPPYNDSELANLSYNNRLPGEELQKYIKNWTDKIPAFKEFIEDHKKFNPDKNLHVEDVWGHPNYIHAATYAPMFMGAGHLIGETYLGIKRALANKAIDLDVNRQTKTALTDLYNRLHTWVDQIDFTAGDSPYNLYESEDLKGWVGSTLARKALPQTKAFNEGIAQLYSSLQSSIDREFSREVYDEAGRKYYLAKHNKEIEEQNVQELKSRLSAVVENYQQATQNYKDVINTVNNEKKEILKQYNNVVDSQKKTEAQLRTATKQYETVSKQYANATNQYNITVDTLNKMKKNIKARSTGDINKASFNFFKDIFSGRKSWDF